MTRTFHHCDSERLFSKLHYQRQLSQRLGWFANFDETADPWSCAIRGGASLEPCKSQKRRST